MPRPCKRRRICALPECERFGPKGDGPARHRPVTMTLDEFESIRLIDLEGMTQEQCALQMDVARTTAQAIYNSARVKLAECLVRERELHIEGGAYLLCDGHADSCGRICKRDGPKMERKKEINTMRIAVTYEDGQVFQHFGHTAFFKLYDVKNGEVTKSEVVSTNGSGHGALAELLRELQVDTLICGGIGGGARAALEEAGIRLYGGVDGAADAAVAALLAGTLSFDPDVQCSHHGENHTCGEEHSCNR